MVERRSPRKRISFGFPSGELRINPLADEDCEVARPVDDAVATPVLTAGWAPALLRHRVATDPDTPRSSVAASPYPLEASLAFPAGLTFDELLGDLGAPAGDLVVPNCFTWSAATRDFSFHYRDVVEGEVDVAVVLGLDDVLEPDDVLVAAELLEVHDLAERPLRVRRIAERVEALLQSDDVVAPLLHGLPDDAVGAYSG